MLSKTKLKKILNTCLATGGDFAELFFEDTNAKVTTLENGIIEHANPSITYGCGIRILKENQQVYGYTSNVDFESLNSLAHDLSLRFKGKRTTKCKDLVEPSNDESFNTYERYGDNVKNKERVKLLKDCYKVMKKVSKSIISIRNNLIENIQSVIVCNSNGLYRTDLRVRTRLALACYAQKGDSIEMGFNGPGASMGFEFFDTFDYLEVAKQVAVAAVTSLKAKPCPSKRMPVIIENGFGGVIFHEACGHSLEASAVSRNMSVFANKLGEVIASKCVSAVDDGTIVHGWGSQKMDDEGNDMTRNQLIKDGELTHYMVDMFNGRRMKTAPTGCSRRESYKYAPTSRMTNTFITEGGATLEEMLKDIKYGLYAKSLGGGSVNPITGDFNFAVNEAYLIKNGKIAYPVKGATLIGTGAEILKQIDMVGSNLKRAQGMCGASSGSVPVDVGQPRIRVKEITVGGKK